jgi:ketosteroid isomerase-like protein
MHAIEELEDRLLQAMRTHDIAVLDELLADDLLFTDHLGRVVTKAWDLSEHRSGRMAIEALVPSERIVRAFPPAVVVSVRLAIRGTYDDARFDGDLRFTRLWMEHDGRWQVVAGASTAVA